MHRPLATSLVLGGLLMFTGEAMAQDGDRIWGRVFTDSGDEYEGFIRWDRNEGSWVDILDGSRPVPDEHYQAWLELARSGDRPVRTIELEGYRISWNEEDPDFPTTASSGVRFGHLRTLTVTGNNRAEVVLRSGQTVELSGGSTDLGWAMREFVVEEPGGDDEELNWGELERIEFRPVPPDVSAEARRLYGTVQDHIGRRFTGYISWDLDEILESDVLDGEDENRDERDFTFGRIRTLEKTLGGARVTLTNGRVHELAGTNDVDRGNRGVQISDPSLGMVEVEWEEFFRLELQPLPRPTSYDSFATPRPLTGTILTRDGERISGRIHWDADEAWSWEFLNGISEGVAFTIEFGEIARIARGDVFGARVTLRDGRSFDLSDSNDVDWDNKGILVSPPTGGSGTADPTTWRYVPWDDFDEARFEAVGEDHTNRPGAGEIHP